MYTNHNPTYFLGKEYLIIALIKAKKEIFSEKFITLSQLSEFEHLIGLEFQRHNINALITSDGIDMEGFEIIDDIVFISKDCNYRLDSLPVTIVKILTNKELLSNFFYQVTKDAFKKIKNFAISSSLPC